MSSSEPYDFFFTHNNTYSQCDAYMYCVQTRTVLLCTGKTCCVNLSCDHKLTWYSWMCLGYIIWWNSIAWTFINRNISWTFLVTVVYLKLNVSSKGNIYWTLEVYHSYYSTDGPLFGAITMNIFRDNDIYMEVYILKISHLLWTLIGPTNLSCVSNWFCIYWNIWKFSIIWFQIPKGRFCVLFTHVHPHRWTCFGVQRMRLTKVIFSDCTLIYVSGNLNKVMKKRTIQGTDIICYWCFAVMR